MNRTRLTENTVWRSRFGSLCLLLRIGFVLLIVTVSRIAALAQDAPQPHKRLKIGVALEGGGALGIAHIAVLRYFEQQHIPIDYISGTSMGGLVGGLYASGHSPDQIEAIVKNMDWPFVMGGATPYDALAYRRKEDAQAIPNDLAVGFKKGLSLPSGLNAGQQISLAIDKEMLAYSTIKSFDDLPIPFRCVSTELISGKAHIFKNGSIALAMRSTMSLPAIFAPIRVGDEMYVDGFLTDNLPTDAVRDMGPDIVIAVHLQTAPATADQIQSLFGVLGRSIDIGSANSELRGMEAADIVIKVDVQKYTSLEFEKADGLLEVGKEAAEAKAQVLRPYALDQAAWDAYIADRNSRKRTYSGAPEFVTVVGTTPDANKKIEAFLQPLVGKPINTPELDTNLTRLTGIGRFNSATYTLTEADGKTGLLVTAHESNYAPPLLQVGFAVDGTEPDNVTFAMAGRLTFLDIAGFGSELRTDFSFGNTYLIGAELYKKFAQGTKFFYAPRFSASQTAARIYAYNTPVAQYALGLASGGLDVGYAASRFTEVRAGYEAGYSNANLKLGTPLFSTFSGRISDTRFQFTTLHLDDPIIPRVGYSAQLNFKWVDTSPGAPAAFPLLALKTEFFKPVSRPASVFLLAQGGSTITTYRTGIPQFLEGGTIQGWLAYGQNEIRGNQYFLGRAGYLHRLAPLPPFIGTNVYAVTMVEVGKMYNAPNVSKLPLDGAAGILAQTSIGPLFIGGSVGDTGHGKWFFALGRVF